MIVWIYTLAYNFQHSGRTVISKSIVEEWGLTNDCLLLATVCNFCASTMSPAVSLGQLANPNPGEKWPLIAGMFIFVYSSQPQNCLAVCLHFDSRFLCKPGLASPPPSFLYLLFLVGKSDTGFFTGLMSFLSLSHQFQSTEGNTNDNNNTNIYNAHM